MARRKNRLATALVIVTAVVAGVGATGQAASTQTAPVGSTAGDECGTYSGEGCAPLANRVDLEPPVFSNPTEVTNPMFPISDLESVVLLGEVDGLPFRAETTLLPYTGVVVVDRQPIEVLLSQYLAYSDGRIIEVALDRYAQADDGSVWYLGEDVYEYDEGTVATTEGTWLAGRDGPPAMIMPADPQVGQAFQTERVPGIVFEEVTISEVGVNADGPFGPVEGAIIGTELHLEGATSQKIFAPGYGEFYTESDGELEALALAVPTDHVHTAEPPELAQLLTAAWGVVESARLEDWEAVDPTLARITDKWSAVAAAPTPFRIARTMDDAVTALTDAVTARDPVAIENAAVDVARLALDVQILYRPVAAVDVERFHLHTQQLRIDAANGDAAGVMAEVATLEWIRDRIVGTLTPDELATVDAELAQLRDAVNTGNLASAADEAARLANDVRTLSADDQS